MSEKEYPGNKEFQKMVAIFDQAGSTLETAFAPMIAQYFHALVAQGLPDYIAKDIAIAYQSDFMANIRSSGE